MSVENEILRIQNNIAAAYAAVADKGGEVPLSPKSAKLAAAVASIPAGGGFPSGGIIVWSGAANEIPTGWALCDGQNGTPDLRGRFVMGAVSNADLPTADNPDAEASFTSNNKTNYGTIASIIFTARTALSNVTVHYDMQANKTYDKLYIYLNGTKLLGLTGGTTAASALVGDLSVSDNLEIQFYHGSTMSSREVTIKIQNTVNSSSHIYTAGEILNLFQISFPRNYIFDPSFSITDPNPYPDKLNYSGAGEIGGSKEHQLTVEELPAHNHTATIDSYNSSATASTEAPALTRQTKYYGYMVTSAKTGEGFPHNNMPPYYALCYIMKL